LLDLTKTTDINADINNNAFYVVNMNVITLRGSSMTATLNSVVAEESDVTSDIDNNAVIKSQKKYNEPNAA
jgi:hypothetical protein